MGEGSSFMLTVPLRLERRAHGKRMRRPSGKGSAALNSAKTISLFLDGRYPDQACLVYQSALIGVK